MQVKLSMFDWLISNAFSAGRQLACRRLRAIGIQIFSALRTFELCSTCSGSAKLVLYGRYLLLYLLIHILLHAELSCNSPIYILTAISWRWVLLSLTLSTLQSDNNRFTSLAKRFLRAVISVDAATDRASYSTSCVSLSKQDFSFHHTILKQLNIVQQST